MKLNVVDTIMVLLKSLITAGFEKMWLNCHIDIGSQHLGHERITWIRGERIVF